MKNLLPLMTLLGMLLLVVAGTVWVVMTYPQKEVKPAAEYNLSGAQVRQLKRQVLLFIENSRYREADRLLRRIIDALPGNNKAVLMRGKVCYLRGETEQAERIFRQVIISSPENPIARNNLGVVLVGKGLFESGTRALLAAENLSSGSSYILDNLCQTYLLSGKFAQAQRCWELARQNPSATPEEALVLFQRKSAL